MGVRRPPGCICSVLSSGAPPRSCRRPAASAGSRSPPSETPESDRTLLQEERRANCDDSACRYDNAKQTGNKHVDNKTCDYINVSEHRNVSTQTHENRTQLFPTVLPSPHPLAGILVRVVIGHLHLLLPPDAHDLLAVGVPQLLKQTQSAGWRPIK